MRKMRAPFYVVNHTLDIFYKYTPYSKPHPYFRNNYNLILLTIQIPLLVIRDLDSNSIPEK